MTPGNTLKTLIMDQFTLEAKSYEYTREEMNLGCFCGASSLLHASYIKPPVRCLDPSNLESSWNRLLIWHSKESVHSGAPWRSIYCAAAAVLNHPMCLGRFKLQLSGMHSSFKNKKLRPARAMTSENSNGLRTVIIVRRLLTHTGIAIVTVHSHQNRSPFH